MRKLKKAILISCFDWYENRLKPIRDLLMERGYEVLILTTDFDHVKKKQLAYIFLSVHIYMFQRTIATYPLDELYRI